MGYKLRLSILFFIFGLWILLFGFSIAVSPAVRIKDIAKIREARENQIMGFGLVVGLRHTGDSQQTQFTKQALTNLLDRMGLSPQEYSVNKSANSAIDNLTRVPRVQDFKSRNVAAVMVTANLPPFMKPGQKIDVTVSSIGDSTSLQGGTLLMTPLQGADSAVYALAQGPISLSGLDASDYLKSKTVATSGRIPQGAIVEEEVPVNIEESRAEASVSKKGDRLRVSESMFSIILNEPDFTTASRIAYSIAKEGVDARAEDAGVVSVRIMPGDDLVGLISKVENLLVVPDVRAKIVINERTGTVVLGENIKISPVAVTYNSYSVQIGSAENLTNDEEFTSNKRMIEKPKEVSYVNTGANLGDLIKALNSIGATPRDLISILQAIKSAGALNADIEVI